MRRRRRSDRQAPVPPLTDHGHEVVALPARRKSAPDRIPGRAGGDRRRARPRRRHEGASPRPSPRRSSTRPPRSRDRSTCASSSRPSTMTNRLRTEGTRNLLDAGERGGRAQVRRSELRRLALRADRRAGQGRGRSARPATAPAAVRTTMDAIRALERWSRSATWTDGIALRYGGFYGPGTSLSTEAEAEQSRDDPQAALPDRRRRPRDPVADPRRRRSGGDGCGARTRRAGLSTTSSTTTRSRSSEFLPAVAEALWVAKPLARRSRGGSAGCSPATAAARC